MPGPDIERVGRILRQARTLAVAYYKETGKPLGITGEIGEYEAARLLKLNLMGARSPGFDARDRKGRTYQIKTRGLLRAGRT